MSPERPNTDAGDSNPQVTKNFSLTPGLTPVQNLPTLLTSIRRLHREHNIPWLQHSGMHLAGSKEWTSIEERPHTLLLIVELAGANRYRWRDVDADLRKLLRGFNLKESCYVRYYIERPKGTIRREISETAPAHGPLQINTRVPAQTRRERTPSASTSSSIPELVSDSADPADLPPWDPALSVLPRFRPAFQAQRSGRPASRRVGATTQHRERTVRPRSDSNAAAEEELSQSIREFIEGPPAVRTHPPPPTRPESVV